MKKMMWVLLLPIAFFFWSKSSVRADWVECPVTVVSPNDGVLNGSGASQTLSSVGHEYVGVKTSCVPDSNGIKVQFQTPSATNVYFQSANGTAVYHPFSGTRVDSYILTDQSQLSSLQASSPEGLIFGTPGVIPATYSHFQLFSWVTGASPSPSPSQLPTPSPSPSPSPTPSPSQLPSPSPTVSPSPSPNIANNMSGVLSIPSSTSSPTVGVPFTADIEVNGNGQAFNAAQATVTISSNLAIIGVRNPSSSACNFQYTQAPSVGNPSFAGAIVGASSTDCKVITLVVSPTTVGNGTITLTNGSIKSYSNSSEMLSSVNNGAYTINAQSSAPVASGLTEKNFFLNSYPFDTYSTNIVLSGTKSNNLSHIFVNGIESGVSYPSAATWQLSQPLVTGQNTFSLYGQDDAANKTAEQSIVVRKHALGDINGDGVVDITDLSLFAVDWNKTNNLTYSLSDLDGDGKADLTDFSLLAKQELAS